MTRMWLVVGDTTSSGGWVVTGSPYTDIDGKPVSRIGDRATCPRHKGVFPIVDGDITLVVDGQPVALHGSSLACGCKVLAVQQAHVFVDSGGGGTSVPAAAQAVAAAVTTATGAVVRYDEAIRFVSAAGIAVAGVAYTLHLENGKAITGTTDGDGNTKRVVTDAPEKIVQAVLAAKTTSHCALHAKEAGDDGGALVVQVVGVSTNNVDFGVSVHKVETKDDEARELTEGEVRMARLVFGDAIDYENVKVHNGEFLPFGMQDNDTAMTPNGEVYFPTKHFKEDFSTSTLSDQRWLIHELTHVWQHQLGYPVAIRGTLRFLDYSCTLSAGRKLCDYNMEAQGNILADYFLVAFRGHQRGVYETKYVGDPGLLVKLENALEDFIVNPKGKNNLP